MSLIAILSARAPARSLGSGAAALRAALNFGGQSLVEYQARQAIDAGANQVLIHVDTPSSALAVTVDRLSVEGEATVSLVRDLYTLARIIGPEDRVLVFGDGVIVPQTAVTALTNGEAPRLLVTPMVAATSAFERIDARDAWAGLACVPGGTLLKTIDMLGEWDLTLTLVRVAVQEGAYRTELSPEHAMEGQLVLVTDQPAADLALAALSTARDPMAAQRPGLDRYLFSHAARPLVSALVRRQMDGGRVAYAGLGLAVIALGLAISDWPLAALLLALAAHGAIGGAREIGLVTRRMAVAHWQKLAVRIMSLVVLAIIGARAGEGALLAVCGAWLPLAMIALLARRADHGGGSAVPWWAWLTVPIALALVLLGGLMGATASAFALLGLLGLVDMGWLLLGDQPRGDES